MLKENEEADLKYVLVLGRIMREGDWKKNILRTVDASNMKGNFLKLCVIRVGHLSGHRA